MSNGQCDLCSKIVNSLEKCHICKKRICIDCIEPDMEKSDLLCRECWNKKKENNIMKTVTRFLCDECNRVISPEQGYIFQGNVYIVREDVEERGGLIGGKAPGNRMLQDVPESVFCKKCTMELLQIHSNDIIYGGGK